MVVNWNVLIDCNMVAVEKFANNELSGKDFYSVFSNTKSGGTARELLRVHGVSHARKLAFKALKRRELVG